MFAIPILCNFDVKQPDGAVLQAGRSIHSLIVVSGEDVFCVVDPILSEAKQKVLRLRRDFATQHLVYTSPVDEKVAGETAAPAPSLLNELCQNGGGVDVYRSVVRYTPSRGTGCEDVARLFEIRDGVRFLLSGHDKSPFVYLFSLQSVISENLQEYVSFGYIEKRSRSRRDLLFIFESALRKVAIYAL